MFEDNGIEYKINRFSYDIMKMLISFIYTFEVTIPDVNTGRQLLQCANAYQMEELQNFCHNFLVGNTKSESSVDTFRSSKKSSDLIESCLFLLEKLGLEKDLKGILSAVLQKKDLMDILNSL